MQKKQREDVYKRQQGKKIVLSIGGYEGYFSLTSDDAVNQFVSDIKSIINEYGFDGIDIDLEQSSVPVSYTHLDVYKRQTLHYYFRP